MNVLLAALTLVPSIVLGTLRLFIVLNVESSYDPSVVGFETLFLFGFPILCIVLLLVILLVYNGTFASLTKPIKSKRRN